jgi:hypothetical protein
LAVTVFVPLFARTTRAMTPPRSHHFHWTPKSPSDEMNLPGAAVCDDDVIGGSGTTGGAGVCDEVIHSGSEIAGLLVSTTGIGTRSVGLGVCGLLVGGSGSFGSSLGTSTETT